MPDAPGRRFSDRLDGVRIAPRMGLAALAGALAALGQPPWSLPWLSVAAFAAIPVLLAGAHSGRTAALTGWASGAGYFGLGLFWIVEPFFVEPDRYGWMAPFALVLMAGGLALFWALAAWAAHRVVRRRLTRTLAWAVALSSVEMLRAHLFTGFPWALPGYAWSGHGTIQWASVVGMHGLTLATLLAAAALAAAVLAARPALAALPVLLLVLLEAGGSARVPAGDPAAALADRPIVRIVQPNAIQSLKWDPAWAEAFLERLLDLTEEGSDTRPSLIVWPETAVPYLLEDSGGVLGEVAIAARGVPVVLGIQRAEGRRYFNSLILLDAKGEIAALYDKHHLVPFGEYIPLGDIAARFGMAAFAAQEGFGFTPGPGARLIDLGALGRALPLICYEAIFPQDVSASPGRPDLLIQITNDAWFGELAGPYQHLAQAEARAIEQGLPLVRSANTGISAMVDPWGRTVASLPLGASGKIDAPLPPPLPPTYYARLGDKPVVAALFILAAALLFIRWRETD